MYIYIYRVDPQVVLVALVALVALVVLVVAHLPGIAPRFVFFFCVKLVGGGVPLLAHLHTSPASFSWNS